MPVHSINHIQVSCFRRPCFGLWHAGLLGSAVDLRDPADTLWGVELYTGLRVTESGWRVQGSDLDDVLALEGVALSEHGAATVGAEVAGDPVATVGDLGVGLGLALGDLETFTVDNDVGAVSAAGDFLAVTTVAQNSALDFTVELVLDVLAEAASGRHIGDRLYKISVCGREV